MIDRDFGTKRSLLKCDECETVLDYTEPYEVFTEKKDSVEIPSWWFGGFTRIKNKCIAIEMEFPQLKKLESKGISIKEIIQQYINKIEQENDNQ